MTTTDTNSVAPPEANPLSLNSTDRVLAIANTPDYDSGQAAYPAWFHQLVRHLRHYRPWRLLIRSDNSIDLEYLTTLALKAQHRADRPNSPTQQLSLFPNYLPDEVTTVTPNPVHSEPPAIPTFTVITGSNRCAITLSDEILTINPGEQLHEYLRRVADVAVAATIQVTGSQQAALARLGSKAHAQPHSRPTLSLTPTQSSSKTRDLKALL